MSMPRLGEILKTPVSLDVAVFCVFVALLAAAYGVTNHWEQYSRRNACMGRKHQIFCAIQQYWQGHPKAHAQDISLADLIQTRTLEAIPQCKQGGSYQLIPVEQDGIRVHCTYRGHSRDRLARRISSEKK